LETLHKLTLLFLITYLNLMRGGAARQYVQARWTTLLGRCTSQGMGVRFLRQMDWMHAARALGYMRMVALLTWLMMALLVLTAHGGVDHNGFLLGTDFISFWTTGRMLHLGADPYDGAAHIAAQRAFFASQKGYTAFFYPPSFLPFCWPLGYLGYFPALAAWLAATAGIFVTAVRAWWREAGIPMPLWLAMLASPAVGLVVTHGQTSFLVAGVLGLGMWLVPSRPLLAGVLLGLATIKPQFGVLIPMILILTGQWRVFGAAAVAAVGLATLSSWTFGSHLWAEWIAASGRAEAAMAQGAVGYGKMMSTFAALKLLGAPTVVAYALQGAVSLTVAILLAMAAWRSRWSHALAATALAGAPLVTPFVLDYDLVLLAFPMLWLTGLGLRSGFADWEKLAIFLAFAAPLLARSLALKADVPIMPPILALLFWVTWRRCRRDSSISSRRV
jgi:hypothetical protein